LTTKSLTRILAMLTLFGVFSYSVYYVTINRYSIGESDYLAERLDNVVFFMLDGAFGNDEALVWMTENQYSYQLGVTYIAAMTNVIPRAIWSGKPLGGGPRLINMVRPGSYVIGQAGNNSLTTGLLTEARMNFGILGMFFGVFVWAWVANKALFFANKVGNPSLRVTLIIFAISASSLLTYSEFLGYTVRLMVYAFPLLLVSFLAALVSKKRTN